MKAATNQAGARHKPWGMTSESGKDPMDGWKQESMGMDGGNSALYLQVSGVGRQAGEGDSRKSGITGKSVRLSVSSLHCVYTDSHHKQAPLWPRPSRVAHAYLNRQCTHLKKTTPISWQLFLHLHLSPSNYDSSQTGPNRRHGALGSRATGREWGEVMKKVP